MEKGRGVERPLGLEKIFCCESIGVNRRERPEKDHIKMARLDPAYKLNPHLYSLWNLLQPETLQFCGLD